MKELKTKIQNAIVLFWEEDNEEKATETIMELFKEELEKQLPIHGVRFELPDTKEIETRLKHVVDESFEDYEEVAKREYSLGFRACYNWLKIKQMKRKGN